MRSVDISVPLLLDLAATQGFVHSWVSLAAAAAAAAAAVAAAAAALLLYRRRRAEALIAASRKCRFRFWPVTEVASLETTLHAMGLRLPASSIDGTATNHHLQGGALADAVCTVGGATGSFISSDGLILTNHHVAVHAIRAASSAEHDYLRDGFVARTRADELPAPQLEVSIRHSSVDVSAAVLEAAGSEADPAARARKLRARAQSLARAAQAAAPGLRTCCEVHALWPGRTYILVRYERLRDVRIVYVPPMALASFGDEEDSFEWPRHAADFALLRAYVAPDGAPAPAAPETVPCEGEAMHASAHDGAIPCMHAGGNVPCSPRHWLRPSPQGVRPGAFVLLLGFPGRTERYAPSSQLAYTAEVAIPERVSRQRGGGPPRLTASARCPPPLVPALVPPLTSFCGCGHR